MKIKKIISLLMALILCFVALYGCKKNANETNDLFNADNLAINYDNIDNGKIVLNDDINGTITSELYMGNCIKVPVRPPYSAGVYKRNVNEVVVTIPEIKLKAGFFRYSVKAQVLSTGYPDQLLFEIRVINRSGHVVGFQSVPRNAFKGEDFYQIICPFYTENYDTYKFQVFSYNNAEFIISEFSLEEVKIGEVVTQDVSSYMKSTPSLGEDSISLDDNTLYYFDIKKFVKPIMDSRIGYDMISIATTIQGLANRDKPRLFIRFTDPAYPMTMNSVDNFWLDEERKPGGYLENYKICEITKFATLLRIFKPYYVGIVAWDERVPASSNAASTACGVDSLIPVRFDDRAGSLYNILTKEYNIPVKINLQGKFTGTGKIYETEINSTKSKKNDVYYWAYEKYLNKGLCAKRDIVYYTDAMTWDNSGSSIIYNFYSTDNTKATPYEWTFLSNRDFAIQRKAFFYDLFPYSEEGGYTPNDDPHQKPGEDYRTMEMIFEKQSEMADGELFYIGGYNNFALKYAAGVNNVPNDMLDLGGDVANEGLFNRMVSKYYGSVVGDAISFTECANRSIYNMMPRINYNALRSKAPVGYETRAPEKKYYFSLYMGDFDGTSWVNDILPSLWNDPARGKIPLMWPVAPYVERQIPQVYKYLYQTKSENDFFVSSNNGAGGNSHPILESMKDKKYGGTLLDRFLSDTSKEFNRMGLDIVGFVIYDPIPLVNEAAVKLAKMKTDLGIKAIYSNYYANIPDGNMGYLHHVINDVPVLGVEIDMIGNGGAQFTQQALTDHFLRIMDNNKNPEAAEFHNIRRVINKPSDIVAVIRQLQESGYPIEIVDPYTFYAMELKAKYSLRENYVPGGTNL